MPNLALSNMALSNLALSNMALSNLALSNLALSNLAAKPLSRDRQTLSRRAPSQDNSHPHFGPAYALGADRNNTKSSVKRAPECPKRESNERAITKEKEKKRNSIQQDPSNPSSSYFLTDLEQLDANVSQRDGRRKPLLASYRHKCLLPESLPNKGTKKGTKGNYLNAYTQAWQVHPHRHREHVARATPDSKRLLYTSPF